MKKYRAILLYLLLLSVFCSYAQESKKVIKIACIGNSITQGVGVKDRYNHSYPGVLRTLLGEGYEVGNFGVSGRTMLSKGDRPYIKEQKYQDTLAFLPDIVTIKLGTNDTKPRNWVYNEEFKEDLKKMIESFRNLPSNPKIFLCLPVPVAANGKWGIRDSVVFNGVIPYIREVAIEENLLIIDLYTPLKSHPDCFPDTVHPNEEGARMIAEVIYSFLKEQKIVSSL